MRGGTWSRSSCTPLESLDAPIEHDGDGNARHVAFPDGGEQLEKHVTWWRGSFLGMPRSGRPSSRTAPSEPAHAISSTKKPETGDHAPSEL